MADLSRSAILQQRGMVVVKVGTNVLADASGLLDQHRITSLAEQIVRVQKQGWRVVLVSSGAIGAGIGKLKLRKRPTDLPHLQACAAIGQTALMQLYQAALAPYGVQAAQILLTAGDFESRSRYLNVRNTIRTLFEYGCLPIINENDTVSVAEIKFSDNDHLAALVANLMQAPLLVLLTNVAGLYASDPNTNPNAELVPTVPLIDRSISEMAGNTQSKLGTGGMRSKLKAARIATASGSAVIMADGSRDAVLDGIFAGETVGTLFLPHCDAVTAKKRWLGFTVRPKGIAIVDDGAKRAIAELGKSLLPVGVKNISGEFGKGDLISICDTTGTEIARGLCNFSAIEAQAIIGKKAEQIAELLGKVPYDELIHRDNMVLME